MLGQRNLLSWAAGFGAATLFTLVVATQNFVVLAQAGRPLPWLALAAGELPVWYSWVLLMPLIVRLTRRYPPLRQRGRNFVIHVIIGLAATLLVITVTTFLRQWIPGMYPPGIPFHLVVLRTFLNSYIMFVPIYAALVASVLAWSYQQDTQRRELQQHRLEFELARSQLDALRMQIHPHFLFNTLHAISGLMIDDVPAARKMIRRLSELLRVALEDAPDEVPLHDELQFLQQYVEIQQMRFAYRLTVTRDVEPAAHAVLVPRFLLQPLVENSIKHGVAAHRRSGVVQVTASVAGNVLAIEVADDGPGLRDSPAPRTGTGVGLRNTRARLLHTYGDAHRFEIANRESGGAIVRITVPARTRTHALES